MAGSQLDAGSSAHSRTSIACPRIGGGWLNGSALPSATSSCSRTRSKPETQLGDGVLDLQAGVHLQEVEAAALGVEQELDRADADVADRPRDRDRGRAQLLAQLRW